MLRKLMKHELRATMRIMLPLYLVVFVSVLVAQYSVKHLMDQSNRFFNLMGGLLTSVFVLALFSVCIMTLVLMIRRFQKNLLGDEGYLMFTLPVSVHQQIWSKLLVSILWFILTALVVAVGTLLVGLAMVSMAEVRAAAADVMALLRELLTELQWNGSILAIETLVIFFADLCAKCLHFYAALAIGHSFPKHKLAWTVGVWFGLSFVMQLLSILIFQMPSGLQLIYVDTGVSQTPQTSLLLMMAGSLIECGGFYFLTAYFLKKRLNLE